ncbi:hypothetical protein [Geofilum rubicundum]|uniref:Uncharacterized protein n=1 Tax=Geofilum rubicundum JCM 15548 TaxID=1236989 RepID=A0A0E9LSI2_9BACT|nr:hypothetical protein [Geofilum rubicundum]GAO28527.1 hypothetical protein JCM15548_1633 [Geofilum rubicundum JCM 15548]
MGWIGQIGQMGLMGLIGFGADRVEGLNGGDGVKDDRKWDEVVRGRMPGWQTGED